MDQEEANKKYKEWGVLILLDAPEEIELGIDNTSWKIGKKFKGIKLIPPGPHIVYYSLKQEKHMFKISFFINITPQNKIIVKKWHDKFEDFVTATEEETQRYQHGVNDFSLDKYLGPYPYDRFQIWKEVSTYIDQKVLDKLNPIEQKIHMEDQEYLNLEIEENKKQIEDQMISKDLYGEEFGCEKDMEELQQELQENLTLNQNMNQDQNEENVNNNLKNDQNIEEENKSKKNNDNNKNNFGGNDEQSEKQINLSEENQQKSKKQKKIDEKQEAHENIQQRAKEFEDNCQREDFNTIAGTIYYTEIPKKLMNYGITGEQITQAALDKSEILKKILKQNFENDYKLFLGEFQYAFSSFLLGEHYDSFDQWKDMFILATNSDNYLKNHIQFGVDIIPVLYGMLKQFPRDFFIDNISKDNFTKKCLLDFIEICKGLRNHKLQDRTKKLEAMLQDKFLFFPTNNIIQKPDGKYGFDMEDEDAPQIVDLDEQFIKF